MRYPGAPRSDRRDLLHGIAVADPYRWLEDAADRRTREWQDDQRELFLRCRERWPHRAEWSSRLAETAGREITSVPAVRGLRTFFTRVTRNSEHAALYVSEDGVDRVLVDPLVIDPSGDTVLEAWNPSPEGELISYQLSARGTEDCVLLVRDVATGAVADGPIDRVRRTSVAWLPGGASFYYVRRLPPELHPGEELYHRRIYLHRLGTDPAEDVLIFGAGRAASQFYTVAVSPDGRWLTVSAAAGTSPHNELWLADLGLSDPARPALRPVHVGEAARTHTRIVPGTSRGDTMWLRTTAAAPRGRVVSTTPDDPGQATWKTIIPERRDAVLNDFVPLTDDRLPHPVALVSWSRHAVSEITLHDLRDGRELGELKLPGNGSVGPFHTRPAPGHEVWFSYADHTTPRTVLHFDALDERLRTWFPGARAQDEDDGEVRVTVESAVSRDGTTVRVFVVSPAGRPDRPRPLILTGYGGFGASMSPAYSPDVLAWVRAGGVYAISCLRGGGEEGAGWHRAGMGRNKQRVFDDFDAVTDHLIRQGWTTRHRLGIVGSSNGGLLVAAAVTQHPEKYAAAVCLAPLTDMVRYERSGMGPSWRSEFGTADDPGELAALLAYSPYHNVRDDVAYPPVLVGAFDGDTRVDPAHARKFTAALQHSSAGGPVALRVERHVGHGGRATSRLVGLQADVLAFCGHHLGLCPEGDRCACSSAP
ncbi:prolyl endopeptidase [Microtetraspora sp. NBRC 13810]|uniref:prolyl oligopeptidase family serine peptidase n=1 Tax=Microtetraspora sp. NBRC 13810 TaxID=3030990 RepID=UPI0024A0B6C0|nr:prolyl oligopeptidase family serine peptidase [Microtetraspora sp. NBRC 13810]GLW05830.1 prolyl endopeptidase [Microtetraspora sp. NBRC 13810]